MRRNSRYRILLIVLLAGGLSNLGYAQSRYDTAYADLARQRSEKLLVFTDRNLYAVNESIHFSALLLSGADPYPEVRSQVLYTELLNPDGEAIAKSKFLITENASSGQISIPSNLASGIYYLRSYTRWMRNFGARNFSYIPVRVVNPFSKDEQIANTEREKPGLMPVPKDIQHISIIPARQSYATGERVDVEISLKAGTGIDLQDACISVVPAGCIDTASFTYVLDSKPDAAASFQFNFLPDRKGTAISGTIYEKDNPDPAPDIPVHFSVLGEPPAYFVTRSDQQGRFLVNIPPLRGNQEMFVVPEQKDDQSLVVRIENDFSTDPLPFRAGAFGLQQEEEELASRLSLHMQLQAAFMATSGSDTLLTTDLPENTPFYGLAPISVKIDEFINLPNMEEVIENLVPRTAVMRKKGSAFLMINSDNPMISLFRPLVLIDHIPVFDTEVILAIPPSKIDHIEVIPEVYVRGGMKYGGIVSFFSRQGDLAGIQLPEGSYFFDYAGVQPDRLSEHPRFKGTGKIPDTRNTLFWKDHLKLNGDMSVKINFPAASIPGTYLILVRGIASDGKVIHGLNQILVK